MKQGLASSQVLLVVNLSDGGRFLDTSRLAKQIQFIVEIDQAKQVFRQNVVIGTKRQENDAEHSWHMAVMAMILSEYSTTEELDLLKVLKVILVHDLVEIYAGDTFCYDEQGQKDKKEREQEAAEQLFSLLPRDQEQEFKELWLEYEAQTTPEARFAACLDRLQPVILNYYTAGHTWQNPGVNSGKVLERNQMLRQDTPALWDYVNQVIQSAVQQGYLKP